LAADPGIAVRGLICLNPLTNVSTLYEPEDCEGLASPYSIAVDAEGALWIAGECGPGDGQGPKTVRPVHREDGLSGT